MLEQTGASPSAPRAQLTHSSVHRLQFGGAFWIEIFSGVRCGGISISAACVAAQASPEIVRRATAKPNCRMPLSARLIDASGQKWRTDLPPLDLGDFVCLGAAGRHDFHRRALLLADQRARERRGDGDAALLGVGLDFADDLPDRFLVGVLVDQRDGGAELDGVAGEFRDVDDVGTRELVLDLGNAALIVGLLFLRGMILRVLRKVAMRARLGDVLDDARTLPRLALL